MKGVLKSKLVLTLFRSDNNKKKRSFTMKLIRIACCLLVLLLSLVISAFVAVHPAAAQGLNPPRPSGATCPTTGQGTICQGSFTNADENTDIGLSCSSFQILETATFDFRFTIFFNQEGNVTKAVFHLSVVGTLSNSLTGRSVDETEVGTTTDTFATPGDFSTVTSTQTGQVFKVTLPGSGLIVHDVGKVTFAPDGTIAFEGGPHQVLHNQLQELCAALT
jgi:hypothetical protein